MAGKYISDLPKATVVDAESKFVTQRGDSNEYCDGLQIAGLAEGFLNNKITNCLTKIPQDINLVLSEGTLTLKAGSKVYVPNGPGVFDSVTLANDVSSSVIGGASLSTKCVLLYSPSDNKLKAYNVNSMYSGTYLVGTSVTFYDTTSNVVQRYDGGSLTISGLSFPIALITGDSTQITSIDQVFNGFGYIGKTLFVLPGVEGLVPNGRNADGSLNNTKLAVSQVLLKNAPTNSYGYITLNSKAISSPPVSTYSYNSDNNLNYFLGNRVYDAIVGLYISDTNSKITSFNPKTSFHAVDYGDTNHIAVQGKPSEKSKDLTLSSSGAQYTAPANGWFYLEKTANSGEYIEIKDGVGGGSQNAAADGQGLKLLYPAAASRVVTINYTASGTTGAFRFIYDEGAK